MSRADYKPDCGYGWIVVAACFTLNFIMAGLVRVAGVLYVALIDTYGVSREEAMMPFSTRFCMRNMSGPLVGALGQRFGIRPVVILGCLICGLGGLLSAFAPNVTWLTFTWGGIHGFGYGMCNIIHVIAINHYFQKYKGLALGINYTGDCFGSFLLPLLLDFLLETYSLNGTFLVLAGISLNALPAAMLLVPPPWEQHDPVPSKTVKNNQLQMNNKQGIVNECFDDTLLDEDITYRQNDFSRISLPAITVSELLSHEHQDSIHQNVYENVQKLHSSKPRRMDFIDELHCNRTGQNSLLDDSLMLNDIQCLRKSTSLRVPEKNFKRKRLSCQINLNRRNSQMTMSSVLNCQSCVGKSVAEKVSNGHFVNPTCQFSTKLDHFEIQRDRQNSISNVTYETKTESLLHDRETMKVSPIKPRLSYEEEVLDTLDRACEITDTKNEIPEAQEVLQSNPVMRFIKTNIKPMFLIICVTMALFVFLFISVFTVINDYAADNGVPNEYGKYLIIAFSVTDAIGRVGFGIVIDRKWLSLNYVALITTGIMGLCIFIIPLFKSFMFWMISFSICGLVAGGTCIMFPILVGYYMDKNEESLAFGCLNFYGGLLMLPIPPMIGFFRDTMESYDGVFWTVGALCMFAGSLWIFEPFITRRDRNKMHKNSYFNGETEIQ